MCECFKNIGKAALTGIRLKGKKKEVLSLPFSSVHFTVSAFHTYKYMEQEWNVENYEKKGFDLLRKEKLMLIFLLVSS